MTRHLPVLIAGLALSLPGCGGGGPRVSGTVTKAGQPLAGGVVAFEPVAGSGTTGSGAVVEVADGKFTVPSSRPLNPGSYLVRVSPVPLGSGTDLKTAPPQFRPWETKVEIKAGDNPLTLAVP